MHRDNLFGAWRCGISFSTFRRPRSHVENKVQTAKLEIAFQLTWVFPYVKRGVYLQREQE